MYLFLIIFSVILTYCMIINHDKKKIFDSKNINLLIICFFSTTILNHLIIFMTLGNIDISYKMLTITPLFLIKYLFLMILSSSTITLIYIFYHKCIKIMLNDTIERRKLILTNIYYFFLLFLIFTLIFFLKYYSNVPPEQLMFHLQTPITGTSITIILDFMKKTILPTIIIILFLYSQYYIFNHLKKQILFSTKKLKKRILPINYYKKTYKLILIMIALGIIVYAFNNYDIANFIINQFQESSLIETEYVDPKTVELTFPQKKRNLIYIFLESMETSYSEYTTYLNDLAIKNTTFSKNNGFYELVGSNWTIASMVSQTAGLPLKFSVDSTSYNVTNKSFLNNVVTIGEILKNNGYSNYLYMGSDASFAGRDIYFTNHGNYEILDYYEAYNLGYNPMDYYVWWGFEDKKLYEYSKDKLIELAEENEPFNFTLLTVDTHPSDGYLDETCESNYEYQYANVISCADKKLNEFITWVQKQDFYENTTIVIAGDHLYMENSDFIDTLSKDNRYVYNVIINSVEENENNNREYSALDLFPTTLASLGVKINGNKLGMGVNLYSDEQTLIEKYGYDYINEELKKKSTFYQNLSLYE